MTRRGCVYLAAPALVAVAQLGCSTLLGFEDHTVAQTDAAGGRSNPEGDTSGSSGAGGSASGSSDGTSSTGGSGTIDGGDETGSNSTTGTGGPAGSTGNGTGDDSGDSRVSGTVDATDGDAANGAEAGMAWNSCATALHPYPFCEDFEQGRIDDAKWDVLEGGGGTVMLQPQVVAHGKYALQVHGLGAGPSDYGLIVTKNAPAALQGTHFGRAYFFVTPKPQSGHVQLVFAGTNGTGSASGPGPFPQLRQMEVATINGGWQIGFDLLDVAPLVEEVAYPVGSPQVPVMRWSCLEWEFSDQPDFITFWVDGQAIGTFDDQHVSFPAGHTSGTPLYNGASSGLIGTFSIFGFGFHDFHPTRPFDLYYDDIVLDTKRVGCEM